MIAAVLNSPQNISLENIEKPKPKSFEVLIKITAVGICGSDVHIFKGDRLLNHPTILGHEGIGHIVEIGDGVKGFSLGDRVVIEPNIACGKCRYCQKGRGNICINKKVIGLNVHGCFTEYVALDADYCWKLPNTISNDDAVCIEPLAVAVHALKCTKSKPNSSVAIFGLGAIGLLLTQLCISKGYHVYVKDLNHDKQEFAKKQFGAFILPTDDQLGNFLLLNEIETVFDCVGVAKATNLIFETAPRGAEIVLVGLANEMVSFLPLRIAREEISILPSIIYNHPDDFAETIQLIERKDIIPSNIISNRYSLENIHEAIQLASSGKATKVIIDLL